MIVLDHPVTAHSADSRTAELTDEQAAEVATFRATKQLPMWLNGAVTTLKAILDARMMWTDAGWVARPVPPAPVPQSVTPLQIRLALTQLGLRAAVDAAVLAADPGTRDAWEYALEIRRDNPLLAAFAAALGKTPEEVDEIFRIAARL